jgi:serine phosphatase RsbU (regulator of sigma subunit)
VLGELNRILCGKFEDRYVTAAYAVVDTSKRTLRYAGAGHPPLLLLERSTGRARPVIENGLFLGFFPHATYAEVEVPFHEGDSFLLYTDGISDMTNALDEPFGEARLKEFLERHPDLPAAGFADSLLDCLSSWSRSALEREPDDDVTLVAVRFPGR